MSRKGNSMDNGLMENFFGILKTEMFYDQEDNYKTLDDLIKAIDDPCPGHEYFKSDYQYKIDYDKIDDFMKLDNLNKCKNICYDYCIYCPQGVHHEISFMPVTFNEHDSKEEI